MAKSKTPKKVSDLIPDDKNFNQGNEFGESLIEKSFSKFGAGRSILIDKNNRIIAGNKSTQKFAEGGGENIIVVETDGKTLIAVKRTDIDLDSPQGREMALADNASAKANIVFDCELVEAELTEAVAAEWGVEPTKKETVEDDFDAEPPKVPITVLGDVYELNQHRLICGDSTDSDTVAKLMNGKFANLYSTDPPYGVAYNDETGSGKKKKIQNDENDGVKLQGFLEDTFRSWLPFLDKNAAWYIWHAQMTQGFFAAAAAAAADILIHRQIIWVKPSLIMGHGDYHWRHELCFYGWQRGSRPAWYADRKQDTIWNIGRETDSSHPTAKPIEIFARPMLHNTQVNSICAEPFAGSGGQFIAADQLNRVCYGMEIDPCYIDLIVARYIKYKRSQSGAKAAFTIKRNGKELSGKEIQMYLQQIEPKK